MERDQHLPLDFRGLALLHQGMNQLEPRTEPVVGDHRLVEAESSRLRVEGRAAVRNHRDHHLRDRPNINIPTHGRQSTRSAGITATPLARYQRTRTTEMTTTALAANAQA